MKDFSSSINFTNKIKIQPFCPENVCSEFNIKITKKKILFHSLFNSDLIFISKCNQIAINDATHAVNPFYFF